LTQQKHTLKKALLFISLACILATSCDMRYHRARKAKKSRVMKAAMAKKKPTSSNFFQEKSINQPSSVASSKTAQKESKKRVSQDVENLKKLNDKKVNTVIEIHPGRFNFY
jgi:hypothetical protein